MGRWAAVKSYRIESSRRKGKGISQRATECFSLVPRYLRGIGSRVKI